MSSPPQHRLSRLRHHPWGYLAARSGILGAASSEALNASVYAVALPPPDVPVDGQGAARAHLEPALPRRLCGGRGDRLPFGRGVAKLVFPNRMAALALHGYGATFGNSGYMGIPLFLAAFGTDGALPAAIVTVRSSRCR